MIIFWRKIRHCLTVYISMKYLETNIEQIRLWVKENYTHRIITDTLKQNFPEVTRGFSEYTLILPATRNP